MKKSSVSCAKHHGVVANHYAVRSHFRLFGRNCYLSATIVNLVRETAKLIREVFKLFGRNGCLSAGIIRLVREFAQLIREIFSLFVPILTIFFAVLRFPKILLVY